MRFPVSLHDNTTISCPKLTSMAAGSGAVVGVFGEDGEVVAGGDSYSLAWEFGIIVKGANNPATSTLEDWEHELGDFKTTTEEQVVMFDIRIHRDGRRNGTRTLTLDKFREHVLSTKMGRAIGDIGRQWRFNGRSIASTQGDLRVVTPVRQVLFTIGAVLVGQWLRQAIAQVLVFAACQR